VRLGLVVAELVRANNCRPSPSSCKAHIDELAASYEKPADVVRWYFGDRQRMAEVEAVVIENNVTEFVLGKAKVTDKAVSFDELMGQQAEGPARPFPETAAGQPSGACALRAQAPIHFWVQYLLDRRKHERIGHTRPGHGPHGHRAVGPRRARLRHLLAPAARSA
jgi:hypothetical protein